MELDFNERLVVDFPKGTRTRVIRKHSDQPKQLKRSAMIRTVDALDLLASGTGLTSSVIKKIVSKLEDTFFLISVNARFLAMSIFHLYQVGFFLIKGDTFDVDPEFSFKYDMYDRSIITKMMTVLNEDKDFRDKNSEAYLRFVNKVSFNLLRYERYLFMFYGQSS